MEGVAAALGCLLVGVAAYLGGTAVVQLLDRRRCAPPRRRHARETLIAACEQVGHWVPVVRLSNAAAVVGPSGRLCDALQGRGLELTRRGTVAVALFASCASALAGLLLSRSLLGVPVGLVAVLALALGLVSRHERRRSDGAAAQMPEVLRSLSASLGAGRSLSQAIEYVGRNVGEPLGSEFLRASFEVKGGASVEGAVGELCSRNDVPGMALLGTSLQISQKTGSPLGDLFSRTSQMVSDAVGLRRELQVKTSQVRLSAKVVSGMPVVLACVLVIVSPDYRAGLALPAGRACLCVAALLDVAALLMVRAVMRRSLR